ncbi:hypothetical protein NNJEOMEG_02296 [Fundidesulfovibrio magnetotacticus]|uniref:Transposase n=1 Tax=Fundidesulfovibrio magnetotacticus TaxID=2730080 RepID=A0A6V8LV36_9BACT|nr:Mu transposase C-terminal domain-containing protein [Fundidesulfovibrio magnetotacticus]GFK94451.1 hypothetical protein NNJEOMEG_02296 [Fundidesulfovibrio magnetotacticus]
MALQEAYTASELAPFLGIDARNVRERAKRESWRSRPRKGRGGGNEWLVTSMPSATREAIASALMAQDAPAVPDPAPAPAVQAPAESLGRLTQHQRETALARLAFVREIERAAAMIGKEKAIRNLLKALADGSLAPRLSELVSVANDRFGSGEKRGLSRRRLYEWCSLFASGGDAALAPRHQGKDMAVPAWAPAFLAIWQRPQKPSIADAYRQFADECTGTLPSIFAVRRFLEKVAAPDREAGRATGNALLKLRPYKRRRTDELWPTDVYTADGTTFDAEIQHPLHGSPWKPEITLVIDVATRRCVGLAVGEAENAFTVLDALRVACLWGGIPCILYTDNGPGYKNTLMASEASGMLARLDIELRNSIPGRPQGKGLMERAVQTICVPAAKRLASCSHGDMDQDAGKKVFKITRAGLKQHGKSPLLPTFEAFKTALLDRVDEYNATPHRSLPRVVDASGRRRHLTPDEYWHSFGPRGFAALPVPEGIRDELFMPGIPRKVRNGMVQLFNATYFSEDLADFHGDYVEVRYDIWDASRVYCWTTEGAKICAAELEGNAMDYFPMAQIEAARERRATGRIARLVEKVQRVAPGATVLLPDAPSTHTIMADSIVKAQPLPVKPVLDLQAEPTVPELSTRRPVFTSMQDRYAWLMHNPDSWTDADRKWVAGYVTSDQYADLHTYFEARCIAWPGFEQQARN